MEDTLPVIDICALAGADEPARGRVAQSIGSACRDVGFFAIVGHQVPVGLVEQTFEAAAQFFALPLQTKQRLAIDGLGGNRGYVGLGVEALDEHRGPDHKEAFNIVWTDGRTRAGNVWPDVAQFQETVQRYFDTVLAVGRQLHRAFALDLELPEDYFADKLDAPMATLRLLHYPGASAEPVGAPAGAGTHTDYGNVTLLATDAVAGLQVRRRDGRWMDVPHLPGAFVCNIGDCLMRWTNHRYVSTPHRVQAPRAPRQSIAMFVDPNPQAWVSAIPSCVAPGERPLYEPILAQAYLAQRFAATYSGHSAGTDDASAPLRL